jgi:alkanesulfonate monooxygenase SsuD/methylene tetrahydromethanopterin reductase-like flavin-dependent oxidoreductase (luciferase family)
LTSFGFQYETIERRVKRLRETIQILRGLWSSDDFSFAGRCFRISHARLEPKPTQHSHLPIWIGGRHHKLIDLVAELADGWNYWNIDRDLLVRKTNYLRSRCACLRRSFDQIVKSWSGTIPRNYSTDQLLDYLKTRSDANPGYFIGYFGKYTKWEALEEFADVVSKL